ncbi:hypothetical protein M153_160000950 [Pseudoloma neurophilia]|uniref:Uncharacterized protein n=1 Tax=Pseudoloma neurophilia TaxID=146866 RepID=A0A0R0M6K9_9MICR|nr:hypothetical protein M153_160000950 [Pseudoloma neurophilia]
MTNIFFSLFNEYPIFMTVISVLVLILLIIILKVLCIFCSSLYNYIMDKFDEQKFIQYLNGQKFNFITGKYFHLDSRNDFIIFSTFAHDEQKEILVFPLKKNGQNLIDEKNMPKMSEYVTSYKYEEIFIAIIQNFVKRKGTCYSLVHKNQRPPQIKIVGSKQPQIKSKNEIMNEIDQSSSSESEIREEQQPAQIKRSFFRQLLSKNTSRKRNFKSKNSLNAYNLCNFLYCGLNCVDDQSMFALASINFDTVIFKVLNIKAARIISNETKTFKFDDNLTKDVFAYFLEVMCSKKQKPIEFLTV